MIVFDLEHSGSVERVAVIGSCRVRTPLSTMKSLGKLDLLISQPALTHSFAEARQSYRHGLGEARVPDVFAPYFFQKDKSPAAARYPRKILDGIQTVIVEMCDTRQIRKGEWVFQNNYFAREFVQKRAAELLEWYRAFTKGRDITPEIIEGALAKLAASGHAADPTIEDILRNTRIVKPDRDQIVADAEALAFDRSKRWIFLCHFAIPEDAGAIMTDRRRLAGDVEAAAAAVGAEFFDPTRLIEHYGRRVVLRGDGTDIYEYDWDFVPVMGEILLNLVRQGAGPELEFPYVPPKPVLAKPEAVEVATKPANETAEVSAPVKLMDAEPPAAPEPETAAVGAAELEEASKRVNKLLVKLHRERLERLGAEKSGLFDQYAAMLDNGQVVRARDVEVARTVLEDLPPFERYIVLKAGLGSVALMLALSGRNVTAFEVKVERAAAIQAAVSALTVSKKKVGERMDVQVGLAPDAIGDKSTLCIAVGYVSRVADAEQDKVMRQLSRFDALLVEPRTFLRHRSAEDQALVPAELGAIGFPYVREVSEGIIFASKWQAATAAA